MQWRASQDFAPENYMMPPGPNPYNPYWNGMQPGMDPFMGPPYGGGMPPYMSGYGFGGPMDVPFGGMFPQDPFGIPGGLMMPPFIPPQRYYIRNYLYLFLTTCLHFTRTFGITGGLKFL